MTIAAPIRKNSTAENGRAHPGGSARPEALAPASRRGEKQTHPPLLVFARQVGEMLFPLGPKLHLGTHSRPKFHFAVPALSALRTGGGDARSATARTPGFFLRRPFRRVAAHRRHARPQPQQIPPLRGARAGPQPHPSLSFSRASHSVIDRRYPIRYPGCNMRLQKSLQSYTHPLGDSTRLV